MVLGGVQLIMIGIMGEYIGKILSEIKGAAGLFRRRAQRAHRAGRGRPAIGSCRRRMSADVSQNQNALAPGAAQRPIWLCADDYGISPGVNKAIRDLVVRGRLNATSVMVAAPSFDRSEAASLNMLNAGARRVAIGLHVTLTRPFQPLSERFRPTRKGTFPSLARHVRARHACACSTASASPPRSRRSSKAFVAPFGRPPDFVDGHQHVHLFPQVRDALLDVVKEVAPQAWVRQCGRAPAARGRSDFKAMVLDALSRTFRSRAAAHGIATNPAFAGTYDFTAATRISRNCSRASSRGCRREGDDVPSGLRRCRA